MTENSAGKCWNCFQNLAGGEDFCPNCGVDVVAAKKAPAKKMTLCAECGASFSPESDGQVFCESCNKRKSEGGLSNIERLSRDRQRQLESDRGRHENMRSAMRFEVAKCFVRVQKTGLAAKVLGQSKVKMAPLVDLSTTGLQCVAEGSFAKGDVVNCELLVPAFNNSLALKGVVRWASPERSGYTKLGVQFDESDEKTKMHLTALEKHESLRNAAHLIDEKNAARKSSASMKSVKPEDF